MVRWSCYFVVRKGRGGSFPYSIWASSRRAHSICCVRKCIFISAFLLHPCRGSCNICFHPTEVCDVSVHPCGIPAESMAPHYTHSQLDLYRTSIQMQTKQKQKKLWYNIPGWNSHKEKYLKDQHYYTNGNNSVTFADLGVQIKSGVFTELSLQCCSTSGVKFI